MTTSTKICPHCNQEMKTDYISIEKDKFRIYEWDKPIKDFPMPEGYELAEERDFVDLYDDDKVELEKYPIFYFTKNRSKKNIKNGWGLSWLYLGRDLYLCSDDDYLADSNDGGRVVLVRNQTRVARK
jgi:hypothetical protein